MSETKAVHETRQWRRQVHEQTEALNRDELRHRENELIRQARKAGVEFEDVLPSPKVTSSR